MAFSFQSPASRTPDEENENTPQFAIVPMDFYRDYQRLLQENAELKERQPKRGKWLRTNTKPRRIYCSECLKLYVPDEGWFDRFPFLPKRFCPTCGADNRKRVL